MASICRREWTRHSPQSRHRHGAQWAGNVPFVPPLDPAAASGLRRRGFDIIFRHEPGPSRRFDLLLIGAILISVMAVLLDSVAAIHLRWYQWLLAIEWFFTLLFTVEYAVRLWVVRKPLRYALSSWGVIDLLSILPTYVLCCCPAARR